MKDYLHSVLQWMDHNRYLVIAGILAAAMIGFAAGCESRTSGLGTINPASAIAGAVTVGSILLTGGTMLDNRRKDAVIKSQQAPATATT